MAGGGSSDVTPVGGAVMIDNHTFLPSPPLAALKHELPRARIAFDAGARSCCRRGARSAIGRRDRLRHPARQRRVRRRASSWSAIRTRSSPQSPRPIPRRSSWPRPAARSSCPGSTHVPAILEAFYPGIRGGPAIARILTGKVNPSGHLPISFPASADQLAHPADRRAWRARRNARRQSLYDEGAAIGYKWYDAKGYKPLWAFGHGLSYTQLRPSDLTAQPDGTRDQGQLHHPQHRQARRAKASPRSMSRRPIGRKPAGKRQSGSARSPRPTSSPARASASS